MNALLGKVNLVSSLCDFKAMMSLKEMQNGSSFVLLCKSNQLNVARLSDTDEWTCLFEGWHHNDRLR